MPFSRKDKEQVLLLSARRCCVCRRFKGVGVQVHHIIPESDEGQNILDNAIVLCLDCHAAAGHYNPRHPIGHKFSPNELRKHRDNWFERVQMAGIESLEPEFDGCYTRHLLCVDTKAASECLERQDADLPLRMNGLYNSRAAGFMRWVVADEAYPDGDPPPTLIENEDFETFLSILKNEEDFENPFLIFNNEENAGNPLRSYASTQVSEGNAETEHEFRSKNTDLDTQTMRRALRASDTETELNSHLLAQMVSEGTDLSIVGEVQGKFEPCGGGFWRYYIARKRLFLFSEIQNVSDKAFSVSGLIFLESGQHDQVNLRKLSSDRTSASYQAIPPFRLEPGESLLVPELTLLAPDTGVPLRLNPGEQTMHIGSMQTQSLGYYTSRRNADDYWIVGPRSEVVGVTVHGQGNLGVHSFDPTNTYILNRFWEMGSCPHLLYLDYYGHWHYFRELFPTANRVAMEDRVVLPNEARRLRITELEMEVTFLTMVKQNNRDLLSKPCYLQQGEFIEFDVTPSDELIIRGSYSSRLRALGRPPAQIWLKQSLINDELHHLNSQITTSVVTLA